MQDHHEGPRLTKIGRLAFTLFIAGCGFGAYKLLQRDKSGTSTATPTTQATGKTSITISYGSEKKRWLEWAAAEFPKTPEGANTTVELLSRGSLEGARAIAAGTDKVHGWTPAGSLAREVFLSDWASQQSGQPIAREEMLALSPMVFVIWEERHAVFAQKYGEVNFETLSKALQEPGGWGNLGGKPEWGFFKLGLSDPAKSNSGLTTLALMAAHFHGKTQSLSPADVAQAEFQAFFQKLAKSVTGLSPSSGSMMKEMILKGPATYDCLLTYESVAVEALASAEGRWGKLRLVYPKINFWNDHPFYALNAPWASREQRQATEAFLKFLLSETAQREALKYGLRPGEPSVPILGQGSPFKNLTASGLRVEIPAVCQPPSADAILNLLTGWQRAR
jgi:ABC-type Fe3+ transport system substrate-binding protein